MKAQDHDSVAPRSRNLFRGWRVLQCLRSGYFEVSFDTGHDAVDVRVQIGDPCSLFFIIERVRAIFDLDSGLDECRSPPEKWSGDYFDLLPST